MNEIQNVNVRTVFNAGHSHLDKHEYLTSERFREDLSVDNITIEKDVVFRDCLFHLIGNGEGDIEVGRRAADRLAIVGKDPVST